MYTTQRQRVSLQRPLTAVAHSQATFRYREDDKRVQNPIWRRVQIFAVAFLLVVLIGHNLWTKHVSAQALAAQQAHEQAVAAAQYRADAFGEKVNAALANVPGDAVSVSVASSGDQAVRSYGSDDAMDAASVGKLVTAVDFLQHVQNGTARLDERIDGRPAGYLLKIMLVKSDDEAWSSLNTRLGHSDLSRFADSAGLKAYDPSSNTMASADVATLLQKLYNGHLVNDSYRSLLLQDLKEANYRDYIVAAVPAGDTVYHKVGFDADQLNDAAIITKDGKSVTLVIMTNGNGNYDTAERVNLMHRLTKDALSTYLTADAN